ncbi:putative methyltransferase [Phaeomoniella chlamydospora]|uniref:Putative methyltransferase n=1 Tax=Phaeomoniella chlamydospora TaxID=158046 RepID=A0A0G2E6X9_PHACM|nr:putative methyltransferase [Phaeomoniella chlamydospora]
MMANGALYLAPLQLEESDQTFRVLDMGCGTGIWAVDFADECSSNVEVIGCDLSPIQPAFVPPSCKFYIDDLESEWTYPPQQHFDYIHGRALSGSIADWPKLFSQIRQNLRPGGWIEMQDYECDIYADDDTLAQVPHLTDWVNEINEAANSFGKPLKSAQNFVDYAKDAGFDDVQSKVIRVPVGPWAKGSKNKQLGVYYREQFLNSVEPFTLALYTRVLNYTADEARIIIAKVKHDLANPKAHVYVKFHFVWARQPV